MNLLNKKDDLNIVEYVLKLEKEYNKKSLKSKPLTKDFIEKIDKCKTNEELNVVFDEIDSNRKNLIVDDKTILFNKLLDKTNLIKKEIK